MGFCRSFGLSIHPRSSDWVDDRVALWSFDTYGTQVPLSPKQRNWCGVLVELSSVCQGVVLWVAFGRENTCRVISNSNSWSALAFEPLDMSIFNGGVVSWVAFGRENTFRMISNSNSWSALASELLDVALFKGCDLPVVFKTNSINRWVGTSSPSPFPTSSSFASNLEHSFSLKVINGNHWCRVVIGVVGQRRRGCSL